MLVGKAWHGIRYQSGMNANEPSKPDITLSTGRVVRHTRMANGAHDASMADGGDMSESEWEDYCSILAKRNAAFIERQRNLRKSEALDKIAGRNWAAGYNTPSHNFSV